jgi:hypothetical protein
MRGRNGTWHRFHYASDDPSGIGGQYLAQPSPYLIRAAVGRLDTVGAAASS